MIQELELAEIDFNKDEFFSKVYKYFNIKCTSKYHPKINFIQEIEIQDVIKGIDSYEKVTGIIVYDIPIDKNIYLYLFLFDKEIVIFDKSDLHHFLPFLNEISNKTQIYFYDTKFKQNFKKMMTDRVQNTTEHDKCPNRTDLIQKIKIQISKCIIRKSQIRTQNHRYDENSISKQQFTDKIIIADFLSFQYLAKSASLCFNVKNQFLYVMKAFLKNGPKKLPDMKFEHEIEFYKSAKIDNPFICKFYGESEDENLNYIIIEYIGGKTLYKFIKSENDHLNKVDKIRIIIEIMSAIENLHMRNIMYRDLKYDNIIVDERKNAF